MTMKTHFFPSRALRRLLGAAATSLALLGLTIAPALLAPDAARAEAKGEVEVQTLLGKSLFMPGEAMPVSLRVVNNTNKKVALQFNTTQRYDFMIFRKGEANPLYTWSAGLAFGMQAGTLELGKDKSQLFPGKLTPGKLTPGKYRIAGMLTSTPSIQAPNVEFEIFGNTSNNPIQPAKAKSALTVSIATDKKTYTKGEPITVTWTVSNPGQSAATIDFKDEPRYQLIIRDENGDKVWDLRKNMSLLVQIPTLTLQPGQSKTDALPLSQNGGDNAILKPGKYTLHATYGFEPNLKADPITIKIEKP